MILTAYQPIGGYFIPRGKGIAFIVHLHCLVVFQEFFVGFFFHRVHRIKIILKYDYLTLTGITILSQKCSRIIRYNLMQYPGHPFSGMRVPYPCVGDTVGAFKAPAIWWSSRGKATNLEEKLKFQTSSTPLNIDLVWHGVRCGGVG